MIYHDHHLNILSIIRPSRHKGLAPIIAVVIFAAYCSLCYVQFVALTHFVRGQELLCHHDDSPDTATPVIVVVIFSISSFIRSGTSYWSSFFSCLSCHIVWSSGLELELELFHSPLLSHHRYNTCLWATSDSSLDTLSHSFFAFQANIMHLVSYQLSKAFYYSAIIPSAIQPLNLFSMTFKPGNICHKIRLHINIVVNTHSFILLNIPHNNIFSDLPWIEFPWIF